MKAYVDELPENCLKCIFADNQKGYCDLLETRILRQFTIRAIGCPLQSLSDYTKQVRKEVIKEIKENMNKFGRKNIYNNNGDVVGVLEALSINEIIKILDQLQGENNNERTRT